MIEPTEGMVERDRLMYMLTGYISKGAGEMVYKDGLTADEIVFACFRGEEEKIRAFAAEEMHEEEWLILPESGDVPLLYGFVGAYICDDLAERMPDKKSDLTDPAPSGRVKVIIVGWDGVGIYNVTPTAPPRTLQ